MCIDYKDVDDLSRADFGALFLIYSCNYLVKAARNIICLCRNFVGKTNFDLIVALNVHLKQSRFSY